MFHYILEPPFTQSAIDPVDSNHKENTDTHFQFVSASA